MGSYRSHPKHPHPFLLLLFTWLTSFLDLFEIVGYGSKRKRKSSEKKTQEEEENEVGSVDLGSVVS